MLIVEHVVVHQADVSLSVVCSVLSVLQSVTRLSSPSEVRFITI